MPENHESHARKLQNKFKKQWYEKKKQLTKVNICKYLTLNSAKP